MTAASLNDFVQEVSGQSHFRVEHDFGDGFVRLHTSEAERRQAAQDIQCSENIVLELLRNSRDAHATHVFLATCREGNLRKIVVIDDGDGIPASMHLHVFEPRVTSKLDTSHMDSWGLHGRGMALFSIAENASEARVACSDVDLGCAMSVESDVTRLPEKTDQSSFPTFTMGEGATVNVRGPRNIMRTACEFAIAERDTCSVYVGSPAEIAATLYEYGSSTLSAIDRAFCRDETRLPLAKRLATASDPRDLARIAETMALEISERTARRILDGQISPADALLDCIVITPAEDAEKRRSAKPRAQASHVRLSAGDRDEFAAAVMKAYAPIADRYYLESDVEPHIVVGQGRIAITLPLIEK